MLRLEFSNQIKEPVWLVSPNLKIGRSKTNDIILDEDGISGFHALLTVESGHVYIKDTGSAKGTYINNQRITKKMELHAYDKISISDINFEVTEPSSNSGQEYQEPVSKSKADHWSLQAQKGINASNPSTSKPQPLEGTMIVGRDKQCEIVIDSKHISRKHCKLQIQGGVVRITDLNSANGTYLNGKKITEGYARAGDELRFQEQIFLLNGPFIDQEKTVIISASNPPPALTPKTHHDPAHSTSEFKEKSPLTNDVRANTTVRLAKIKEARNALQGTSSKHYVKNSVPIVIAVIGGLTIITALLFVSL